MENKEYETLKRAKYYIECLADGIDPITNKKVNENDVVNNVKVSRCLHFVKDVLDENIKNYKVKKIPFNITKEQLVNFEYVENINISKITAYINDFIDDGMEKLKVVTITKWLFNNGYLTNEEKRKLPTKKGIELGLTVEDRVNFNGIHYQVVLYSIDMQKIIISNIENIVLCANDLLWNIELDKQLVSLYRNKMTISDIAKQLNTNQQDIIRRLNYLKNEYKSSKNN